MMQRSGVAANRRVVEDSRCTWEYRCRDQAFALQRLIGRPRGLGTGMTRRRSILVTIWPCWLRWILDTEPAAGTPLNNQLSEVGYVLVFCFAPH